MALVLDLCWFCSDPGSCFCAEAHSQQGGASITPPITGQRCGDYPIWRKRPCELMNREKPDVIWNQTSILVLLKCPQVEALKIPDVRATWPFSSKHSYYFVLHILTLLQVKGPSAESVHVLAASTLWRLEQVGREVRLMMNTSPPVLSQ